MYDLQPVQKCYAEWLAEFNWQWFVTLTFRDPPHPEAAEKKFGYWVHQINQSIYGRRYKKHHYDGINWVLATEYHRSGDIHFHALLGDIEDLNVRCSRKDARNLWYRLAGIGRVDAIDDRLFAVTNYVSKYLTKGGELTIGPGLEQYMRQTPIEGLQ